MKRVPAIGVALVVVLGAGWVWGASGKSDLNRALRIAELRDGLLEGRTAVLDARLDIYSVNFSEASRHLEAARSALRATEARLNSLGRQAETKPLELALAKIDEAQRMAGQLNQDANALGGIRVESDHRRARHPAPATVRIEGGSVGFQIGASSTDLIMLVMSERGAEKLLASKFTLGAEGSVAAGPVGRTVTAQTDAQMHADILSWSRSQGLFAASRAGGSHPARRSG